MKNMEKKGNMFSFREMKKALVVAFMLWAGFAFGAITPTIVPLTPVWTMTPVATYSVANANAGRVYYDPDTHNLLEEIWQASNSIQLLNAQMTPIATASIAYAQFSYNPKYNNQYYALRSDAANPIQIYDVNLNPVATFATTPGVNYPPSFDSAGNVWIIAAPQSTVTLYKWPAASFATPGNTPVATYIIPNVTPVPYLAIDKNNNLYITKYGGNIAVYNNSMTPIATIGYSTGSTTFKEAYLAADGHILESSRADNFFKVYTNYLSPTPVTTWTITNARGMSVDVNDNLYMINQTSGYLWKFKPGFAPTNTFTPTATFTATPTVTITPHIAVTFVPDKPASWMLGDTVKVSFNWIYTGYAPSGTGIGIYPNIGGAGTASYPTPAATMVDTARPQINWVIGPGTNLSGTYDYYYLITNLTSSQVLGLYSGSMLVNDSIGHMIVTATPTLTSTFTITPTATRTTTLTVTKTVTQTGTPTVTQTVTRTGTTTFTVTATSTKTVTPSVTQTVTATTTQTITRTVTPTLTVTQTATPTITNTAAMEPCAPIVYVNSGSSGSQYSHEVTQFDLVNTATGPSIMLISVFGDPAIPVDSISYGGVSASYVTGTGINGNAGLRVYSISNPPAGDNIVSVTTDAYDYTLVTAVIYDNVGGIGSAQANTLNWANGTSVNITAQNSGDAIVAFGSVRSCSSTITWGAPTSTRLYTSYSYDRGTGISDMFNAASGTQYTPNYVDGCSPGEVLSLISVDLLANSYCLTSTSTMTPTVTATYSATCTITRTFTDTKTITPTRSVTPTVTESFTDSPTSTATGTKTATPTSTGTVTPTGTATDTPPYTFTATPTSTSTATATPTVTPTSTVIPVMQMTVVMNSFYFIPGQEIQAYITSYVENAAKNVSIAAESLFTDVSANWSGVASVPTPFAQETGEGYAADIYSIGDIANSKPYDILLTGTAMASTVPGENSFILNFGMYSDGDYEYGGASYMIYVNTVTPSITPTFVNTFTPTISSTGTATSTVTSTYTVTQTRTMTATFTITSTRTQTATPSFTPTNTVNPAFSRTFTPTVTKTITLTQTRTVTPTKTRTLSPTISPTWSKTATRTATPTISKTFTITQTVTKTTSTVTPTSTKTYTKTVTNTITTTKTITPTFTISNTFTVLRSFTPTFTVTPTFTITSTSTVTPTVTPTAMGLSEQTERLYYMLSVAVTNTAANFSGTIADRDTTGPGFLIQNWSNKYDIDLSKLSLRYWMKDEAADQGYGLNNYVLGIHGAVKSDYVKNEGLAGDPPAEFCYTYWESVTNSVTNFVYVTLTAVNQSNQDAAMDISFTAGILPHNETDCNTIPPSRSQANNNITINNISSYIDNSNYYFNPGNDWSFTNDICDYSANKHRAGLITVYYDGREILGHEPVETGKYDLQVDCGGFGTSNAVYDFKCDRPYNGGAWGASAYTDARYTDLQETYNARLTPEATMMIYENQYLHISGAAPEEESIYQSVVRNYNYKYNAYVNNNNANNFARNDYINWRDMCAFYGNDYYLVEAKQVTNYNFDNLPNGQYNVKLRFAEIDPMIMAGQDVCNVYINGVIAVNRLDVFAVAGYAAKYDVDTTATVTNGRLQISYEPSDELAYMAVRGCLAGIDLHLVSGTFTGMSPKWGCTFPPGPFDPAFPYLNPIYDACNGYEIPIPTFTITPTITQTWTQCITQTITPTVTLTATVVPTVCVGEWQNVGNAGFSAGTILDTSLFVNNGTPYVAYKDDGNSDKATVMTYNGVSWTAVGGTGFSAGYVEYTSLFIYNNVPYVAYRDAQTAATVMKYENNSWTNVGNRLFSPGDAMYTSLFVYDGTPYIAFSDGAHSYGATVMSYNGVSWTAVGNEGFSSGRANDTSIFVYEGTPYIVYSDIANSFKSTVMKFDGSSWVNVGNAGFSAGMVSFPSIYVYDGIPYVVYRDDANLSAITVMKYDGGWVNVGSADFTAANSNMPVLKVFDGVPYVAYMDGGITSKATVMKFTGNGSTGWEMVGSEGFSAGGIGFPSLYLYNGIPYIAYSDNNSSEKCTVMKFDCATPEATSTPTATVTATTCNRVWQFEGNSDFSTEQAYNYKMKIYNGTPYVFYGNGVQMNVMKFDGANWGPVGVTNFASDTTVDDLFVENNIPYIAYSDNQGLVTVMKYTGNWQIVGNAGFVNCYLNYLSLFVENGIPYVFFRDASANNSGSVKKFNGSAWVDVGNADFTVQGIDTITLYVKNSIPYVLFCDSANGYRTTAMELIGNNWQIIGNAGFSTMSVYVNFGMDFSPLSLIMHNNILYAGFNDGGAMTVMQLNGSTWTPVGVARFTGSNITPYFENLDFMGDNPCIMFSDFNSNTTSYVMIYDGSNWQTIASEVFNQMTITNFSLDPNSSIPYVAFRDQNNSYKLSVRKYDCP